MRRNQLYEVGTDSRYRELQIQRPQSVNDLCILETGKQPGWWEYNVVPGETRKVNRKQIMAL